MIYQVYKCGISLERVISNMNIWNWALVQISIYTHSERETESERERDLGAQGIMGRIQFVKRNSRMRKERLTFCFVCFVSFFNLGGGGEGGGGKSIRWASGRSHIQALYVVHRTMWQYSYHSVVLLVFTSAACCPLYSTTFCPCRTGRSCYAASLACSKFLLMRPPTQRLRKTRSWTSWWTCWPTRLLAQRGRNILVSFLYIYICFVFFIRCIEL